jgi:hypothetical protein
VARRIKDPLEKIKNAVYKKWEINSALPKMYQMQFTRGVTQATALATKDALID